MCSGCSCTVDGTGDIRDSGLIPGLGRSPGPGSRGLATTLTSGLVFAIFSDLKDDLGKELALCQCLKMARGPGGPDSWKDGGRREKPGTLGGQRGYTKFRGREGFWGTAVAEKVKQLAHPWLFQAGRRAGHLTCPLLPPAAAGLRRRWWGSDFGSCWR